MMKQAIYILSLLTLLTSSCLSDEDLDSFDVSDEDIQSDIDFFIENSQREGVITTNSGLQYEILQSGDSLQSSPLLIDTFTAHYEGWTILGGNKFDSSIDRGEPLTLEVSRVIEGWREVLQLMVPGDKWRVYIPYQLAYGAAGVPPDIPPYASLVFEIELISFQSR